MTLLRPQSCSVYVFTSIHLLTTMQPEFGNWYWVLKRLSLKNSKIEWLCEPCRTKLLLLNIAVKRHDVLLHIRKACKNDCRWWHDCFTVILHSCEKDRVFIKSGLCTVNYIRWGGRKRKNLQWSQKTFLFRFSVSCSQKYKAERVSPCVILSCVLIDVNCRWMLTVLTEFNLYLAFPET